MNRPVFAVDFDDVVAGFNNAYIAHHNKHYGTSLTFKEAYTFDMPKLYGLDHEEVVKRVRHFCHNHHHEVQPIVDALEVLQAISTNSELHIVTSRCETLRIITEEWVYLRSRNPFREFHFTNGFGAVGGIKRSKLEVCHKINACLLIEDGPGNALEVADGGIPVLLFDRPWNQDVEHFNVTRVQNWRDISGWIAANFDHQELDA